MSLDSDEQSSSSHWTRRPGLSRLVAWARWLVPPILAVVTAIVIAVVIPEPRGALGLIAWWAGVLVAAGIVLAVSWREAKRLIPLSILLGMGLVFPGDAPSRLSIAVLAAGASRGQDPERGLAMAQLIKTAEDPGVAAQRTVTLAAAVGANDPAVRGHAQRVAELAYLVGYELHLAEEDRERLRWAALLHDIGKVVVHPGIINKRSSLSSGERKLLRGHPLEGEKLTAPLAGWLGEWASTIPEHHERYDGEGYPDGLAGEEISLGARIVSVVDAYDTMTHVRANRRVLSPDAARAELARCGGDQYDPEVIRAFLAIPKRRLHRRPVPVVILNTIPIGADGPELAAVGRIAAAVIVAGSAVGLLGWKAWTADQRGSGVGSEAAAAEPANSNSAAEPASQDPELGPGDALPDAPVAIGSDPRTSATVARGRQADSPTTDGRSGSRGSSGGGHSPSTKAGSGGSGTADPPPTSPPRPPSTTSHPTPPPTTSHPSPPPTTSHPKPPPTTSHPKPPPPPTTTTPPAPVTGLSASASCINVVVGPEIKVSWTDSRSPVRGYLVLRSSNGTSYSPVGFVGSSTSSYDDKNVQGLGITYWYEVESRSTSGSSTSRAVSATTPLLCLSPASASRGKTGGDVEHRDGAGEDRGLADVAFGVYLDDVYGSDRRV
jgi:hypothetical protein